MTTPGQAMAKGFPWIPVIVAFIIAVPFAIWAIVALSSPAVNGIDATSQRNAVNHLRREQAVNNQQYRNTTQGQQYQDNLVSGPDGIDSHLENILGPSGLAVIRASLPASSPEQDNVRAQEMNEITLMCAEAQKLNTSNPALNAGTPPLKAILAANCLAGGPVQDPPLARNPVPGNGA